MIDILKGDLKTVLEALYLFSGTGLFIVSSFALKQLSIAKKDIQVRCERESVLQSMLQTEKFCRDILPLHNLIFKKMLATGFKFYDSKVCSFYYEEDGQEVKNWFRDFSRKYKDDLELMENMSNLINSLESVATCFVKGVANEEVAFSSVGKTFCNLIQDIYPVIAVGRKRNEHNYYDNTIILYNLWSERVEKINLRCKLDLKKKDLHETLNQYNSIQDQSIKPVGLDQ